MRILHTEASKGWGGQEMRILQEAVGMRDRGYELEFAVIEGGQLADRARKEGFVAHEFPFSRAKIKTLISFIDFLQVNHFDIINTHSSIDAWIAGLAARFVKTKIIRTRHISSAIKKGLNSRIVYKWLSDYVVTTCKETAETICTQAGLSKEVCRSIPTGVHIDQVQVDADQIEQFRKRWCIEKDDILIGTVCVLRSWKGISEMLQAAKLLHCEPHLKWMIVGEGPCETRYREECHKLGLDDKVLFTGYLSPPYEALAAMDIFLLLSTASEGVSQASLQAAYLEKPLITTPIGGLKEICLPDKTGLIVPPFAPQLVAKSVMELAKDPAKRKKFGTTIKHLICDQFTFEKTLDDMERVYFHLFR